MILPGRGDVGEIALARPAHEAELLVEAVAAGEAGIRPEHHLGAAPVPGEGERAGWEAWNGEFLATIARAAQEHPGKRIVVLVGAEHGYWLRAALARTPGLRLLDTASLLAAAGD